jgi:hypothetical protein
MSQAVEQRPSKPTIPKDSAFQWEDPLDLEGKLAEEKRMVRDTARRRASRSFSERQPHHSQWQFI